MPRRALLLLLLGVLAAAALLLWWPEGGRNPPTTESARSGQAHGGGASPAAGARIAAEAGSTGSDLAIARRSAIPVQDAAAHPPRLIQVLLLDVARRPLADLPVTVQDRRMRTDDRGRVPLRLPDATMPYQREVFSPGYLPRRFQIPMDCRGELEVVLRRSTLVEFRLEAPPGEPAEQFEFCLSLPEGVRLERGDSTGMALEPLMHPGFRPSGRIGDSSTSRQWYWVAGEEPQSLTGLPAGHAVQSQLRWRGLLCERRTMAPLQVGEQRVEVFRVPQVPLRQVVAVDEQGNPLPDARMRVSSPTPAGYDREISFAQEVVGGWRIPDLAAHETRFDFIAADRLTASFHGAPPAQVVLPPLAELTVRMVMEDGSPLPGGIQVRVSYLDRLGVTRILKPVPLTPPAAPLFHGLPTALVTVTATGEAIEPAELQHHVRSGELRMVLRARE